MIMRMVTILMHLAPFGVFCLLAKLFTEEGFSAIYNLALYFMTVTLVLACHAGAGLYQYFQSIYPPKSIDVIKEYTPGHAVCFQYLIQ